MSDQEIDALVNYHITEAQKLIASKKKETPVVINESRQQVRANRLSKFTTKK